MDKATSFNLGGKRNWHLIDAKKDTIGRIAGQAAQLLQGKHKPTYSPQADEGDFVVIVNTKYLRVSHPNKWEGKTYFRYSGYPGGMKKRTLKETFDIDPSEIIRKAVYGMLPKNKLRKHRIKRLKLFTEEEKGNKLYEGMKKSKKVSKKCGK